MKRRDKKERKTFLCAAGKHEHPSKYAAKTCAACKMEMPLIGQVRIEYAFETVYTKRSFVGKAGA